MQGVENLQLKMFLKGEFSMQEKFSFSCIEMIFIVNLF